MFKKLTDGFLKHKWIILAAIVIIAALVTAFIYGNKSQPNEAQSASVTETVTQAYTDATSQANNATVASTEGSTQLTSQPSTSAAEQTTVPAETAVTSKPVTMEPPEQVQASREQTETDTERSTEKPTSPVQNLTSEPPKPVAPQEQTTSNDKIICNFSVSCASILKHMDMLDEEKTELIPADGWIIKPVEIEVNEGESVFDILKRECKNRSIHLAFRWTPIYNSAYVEGINNIYEMDCGSSSGWTYYINDYFPNFGMSQYVPKNGDTIKICYSCVLGDKEELALWSTE